MKEKITTPDKVFKVEHEIEQEPLKREKGIDIEQLAANAALLQAERMRKEIEEKINENLKSEAITDSKIDSVVDEVWRELKRMYEEYLESENQEIKRSNQPLFVFLGLKVMPDPEKIEEIKKEISEK